MRPTDALPHPQDWRTTTVGLSVELKRGVSWSKSQEHPKPSPGRVPVIRIGNVQDQLELDDLLYLSDLSQTAVENKRVTAGWTIIVGSNGNRRRIGNAVFVREDASFLFASFLLGAKPKEPRELRPEYFYRWLSTEQVQGYLSASSEGTTGLNNLSHSFFRSMVIPFPSPEEQGSITRILDAVDAALDHTRAVIDRARIVKCAILQKFFYDALGETAYADRPARPLPAGWSLTPMAQLLRTDPKNGVSPQTSPDPPGTPTFSIAAIRDGHIDLGGDHLKYVPRSISVPSRYQISRGDVLIVRGNANPDLVGKAGMVADHPPGCVYPDIVKRVTFNEEPGTSVTPEFAVLAWNQAVVHNQLLRRAKTSNGTLKINNRDVKQVIVPVPPGEEQAKLVQLCAGVDAEIDAQARIALSQTQLKKSLMHDLLTGRVRTLDHEEATAL